MGWQPCRMNTATSAALYIHMPKSRNERKCVGSAESGGRTCTGCLAGIASRTQEQPPKGDKRLSVVQGGNLHALPRRGLAAVASTHLFSLPLTSSSPSAGRTVIPAADGNLHPPDLPSDHRSCSVGGRNTCRQQGCKATSRKENLNPAVSCERKGHRQTAKPNQKKRKKSSLGPSDAVLAKETVSPETRRKAASALSRRSCRGWILDFS
ncbi:hypothetical protein MPH_09945 [Macrophomina phaseolina MS6]|uniref:Uncharacterized protein n=1 Tax=Macrophomina phaseolina (strain MS6) TaxID=1126212 RepID=K2REE4_MACPH|nr:hypothetical protein MPH_09945 [Macrophomina phaseolina MS6]